MSSESRSIRIELAIAAATVYVDRARVTRRGRIHLESGATTISLAGLPLTLAENTVRAGGRGAGLTIIGVELSKQFGTRPPESSLQELQSSLQDLQDRDQTLVDSNTTEQDRLSWLRALSQSSAATLARGLGKATASVENADALGQYLASEIGDSLSRQRQVARERRDLAREIQALQSRLGQLQTGWNNARWELAVPVEVETEGDYWFEVQYVVNGASWAPLYDLRVEGAEIELAYFANVRQQSGEDWQAIELSLSTARPAMTSTLPELAPWYIDRLQPAPVMRKMGTSPFPAGQAGQAPPGAPMMMAAQAPPPPPPARTVSAQVVTAGAVVTYRAPRPVTVPADGSPHKVAVSTLELRAELDYLTIPKLAEEVYARAKIKNSSEYTLLPGSASIYRSGDFAGAVGLDTVVAGEEFEAQLGVDDRIKVERKLKERSTTKSLIGNTRRIVLAYTIRLTNNTPAKARVTVIDHIPLARSEEIRVKLQEATPVPTEQSELHVLQWVLELPPGESGEINYAFSVEHPREMTVTGLEI